MGNITPKKEEEGFGAIITKLLRKAADEENQKTLATIKEHGVVLSNRVAIVLAILFNIAFAGWMYCMTKLLCQ